MQCQYVHNEYEYCEDEWACIASQGEDEWGNPVTHQCIGHLQTTTCTHEASVKISQLVRGKEHGQSVCDEHLEEALIAWNTYPPDDGYEPPTATRLEKP